MKLPEREALGGANAAAMTSDPCRDSCRPSHRNRPDRRGLTLAGGAIALLAALGPLPALAAQDDRGGKSGKSDKPGKGRDDKAGKGANPGPGGPKGQGGPPQREPHGGPYVGAATLPPSIGALSPATIRARLGPDAGLLRVGAKPLPPGVAKNLARGKPLPPGIAKQVVPAGIAVHLPRVDGYDWIRIGTTLVLIGIATQVIEAVIEGVFY